MHARRAQRPAYATQGPRHARRRVQCFRESGVDDPIVRPRGRQPVGRACDLKRTLMRDLLEALRWQRVPVGIERRRHITPSPSLLEMMWWSEAKYIVYAKPNWYRHTAHL